MGINVGDHEEEGFNVAVDFRCDSTSDILGRYRSLGFNLKDNFYGGQWILNNYHLSVNALRKSFDLNWRVKKSNKGFFTVHIPKFYFASIGNFMSCPDKFHRFFLLCGILSLGQFFQMLSMLLSADKIGLLCINYWPQLARDFSSKSSLQLDQ